MTDDLWQPLTSPTPTGARPKCRRHEWTAAHGSSTGFRPVVVGRSGAPMERIDGALCLRCGAIRDGTRVRRNRNNKARGKRTSHQLAAYLGGQDVETLGWPWDVQGDGYRLQSKRLAARPSLAAIAGYLEAIPRGAAYLRGFYQVGAGQRLTSGKVFVLLRDWVDWHGWDLPASVLHWTGPLIEMPLPMFRDIHVSLHGPEVPE